MKPNLQRWAQILGDDAVSSVQGIAADAGDLASDTPVVMPDSVDAACEALRFAHDERLRVLPAGALEHRAWGSTPGDVDAVVSTRRLNRILEYEPEDLTVVAQAGVTLHALEEATREHQQRLGPDPWPGTAATLGGACAAQRFGLSRLRYGTLRDAVLGARVVHADGTTTRTGGKVVKNVTGYDLAKLYIGSQGSLVLLAELNLRLLHRPHATAMVHARLPFERARRAVWEVHRGRLQPVAVVVTDRVPADTEAAPADAVHVVVRFEGRSAVVEQQARVCKELLDGRIVPAARELWDALRAFPEPRPATQLLQVSAVPTSVFDVVASARTHVHDDVQFLGLFGVGITWLRTPVADTAALRAFHNDMPRGWCLRVRGPHATITYARAQASALQDAHKARYDPNGVLPSAPATQEEVSP